MLHIQRIEAAPHANEALRAMFEARKRVFVDLLGWDIPVIADRFEVDQFDDPHCTYLLLTDAEGRHLASARLLPTVRPHILGTLYPHLCAGPVPQGEDVFEITRFCLDRDLSAGERRSARDTLVCALADHALAHGIHAYTAIAERRWFEQIRRFGWTVRRLGTEWREGSTWLSALQIEITPDTPARLRAAGLIPNDGLLSHGEREVA